MLRSVMSISNLNELFNIQFAFLLFYFLIPFNFFVYAVNDYFDKDTDQYNPKKGTKEIKYNNDLNLVLKWGLFIFLLMTLGVFAILNTKNQILLVVLISISFFL